MVNMNNNPIAKRLTQLSKYWLSFTDIPEGRICRWLISRDELKMIHAFYLMQTTESNQTGDFFLKFDTPFVDINSYHQALNKEFLEQTQQLKEAIDDESIRQWQPILPHASDFLSFLSNLGSFAYSLNFEGYLIVYLTPQNMVDVEQWAQWLVQALDTGIPKKIRFMLVDACDSPILENVAKYYPRQLISIAPKLQMKAAINELASAGDPANPGVQFSKGFMHLTHAIGRKDMAMVDQMAAKALKIAEQNKWPQMKVTVFMAKGAAYLGDQKFEEAFNIYGEARKVAEEAYAAGDKVSGKLTVTAIFSQGAAMVAGKEYGIAAEVYRQAIPWTKEVQDTYSTMEAWRMAGFCYQLIHDVQNAWDCYWEAQEIAPKLDEALRSNSTLPFVGQALLELAPKVEQEEMISLIRNRMEYLVGSDWAEKTHAL